MIVLPEMFFTPFNKDYMLKFKEPITDNFKTDGLCPTTKLLSDLAQENDTYIIGGSIPEAIDGENRVYNTSLCFNRKGDIVAKHRKLHLFDIDIVGKITSLESGHVKAGPPQFTIFETEYCKVSNYGLIVLCVDWNWNML